MSLDAFAATERRSRVPHRVEHIELCATSDLPRFGDLGVIASMQPVHADVYPDRERAWIGLVGAARSGASWPMAAVVRAGGALALGSDWPVATFDPLRVLGASVAPHPRRLTVREALQAYTAGSARAAGCAHRRGAILPGRDADLVLVEGDLLQDGLVEAGALECSRVLLTMVGGSVVFE
jgi:predicted amidohydrolase YtcJ